MDLEVKARGEIYASHSAKLQTFPTIAWFPRRYRCVHLGHLETFVLAAAVLQLSYVVASVFTSDIWNLIQTCRSFWNSPMGYVLAAQAIGDIWICCPMRMHVAAGVA